MRLITQRSAKVLVSFKSFQTATVAQVPNAKCLIIGCAEQILAAGMEDQTSDPVIMAGQRYQTEASRHVPDFDRLIPRSRSQKRSSQVRLFPMFRAATRWWDVNVRCRNRFLNSGCGWLRSPGDAFHYVFMFAHFNLLGDTNFNYVIF